MKSLAILFTFLLLSSGAAFAQTAWDSSPYNHKNSPFNYENSPFNYNNSPFNYENSPFNTNSDRIIRDNQGNTTGYAVPRKDGGVNYFDLSGNRKGYNPGQSR